MTQEIAKPQRVSDPFIGDLMASLVVFTIALPLSLGIAGASGTSPVTAVVAIMAGGIITGFLSGAPLVVSGPAAGLSALTLQFVQQYGIARLPLIIACAGVFQLIFAAARFGRFMDAIPKLVIEGILSAIGLVIVIGQLHVLSGHAIPGNPVTSLKQLPLACQDVISSMSQSTGHHFQAFATGIVSIVIILAWPRVAPQRLRVIPAALPAIFIATLISWDMDIPRGILQNPADYSTGVLGNLIESFTGGGWIGALTGIWPAALGLAFVASVESLLTAEAVFTMAQKRHIPTMMKTNRELAAQGAGNIASGMLGGLPVSGVMVRSAANIESGARTRDATILHATWIMVFIIVAPDTVAKIPYPALAAVLIVTGIHLINLRHMVEALLNNATRAWLWPMTTIAVLATDLLRGLGIAVVLALLDHLIHAKRGDR